MDNRKEVLTASNIKYLLAIYQLTCKQKGMRCVRIAEQLKVSKPSVHTMMNILKDMSLIKKNHYGEVFFTDAGLKLAERYTAYYQFVSNLLEAYLSDEKDIRCAACAIWQRFLTKDWRSCAILFQTKRKKESDYGDCGI